MLQADDCWWRRSVATGACQTRALGSQPNPGGVAAQKPAGFHAAGLLEGRYQSSGEEEATSEKTTELIQGNSHAFGDDAQGLKLALGEGRLNGRGFAVGASGPSQTSPSGSRPNPPSLVRYARVKAIFLLEPSDEIVDLEAVTAKEFGQLVDGQH
jgi:hypothetical protein